MHASLSIQRSYHYEKHFLGYLLCVVLVFSCVDYGPQNTTSKSTETAAEDSISEQIAEGSASEQTVNIRNLPNTDGEKIGSLSANQEVAVTGQCNETGWYMFDYNGTIAFVSNSYLRVEKAEVPNPASLGVDGKVRYNDLKRKISGISNTMLAKSLRNLPNGERKHSYLKK